MRYLLMVVSFLSVARALETPFAVLPAQQTSVALSGEVLLTSADHVWKAAEVRQKSLDATRLNVLTSSKGQVWFLVRAVQGAELYTYDGTVRRSIALPRLREVFENGQPLNLEH